MYRCLSIDMNPWYNLSMLLSILLTIGMIVKSPVDLMFQLAIPLSS